MYTFTIWDKKSEINGVSHEIVLKNNPAYRNTGVALYTNNSSQTVEIIAIETELRKSYNNADATLEELALMRLNSLNNNAPQTVKELQDKVSTLEQGLANAEYSLMMGGLL